MGSPEYVTPWTGELEEGTYRITMPQQVIVGNKVYSFKQWEDGSTGLTRTINLTADTTITATYELVPLKHVLTVDSTPIQGIPFTIEKVG